MTDISAFPAVRNVLVSGTNIQSFLASEAITAGMLVGHAATGLDTAVVPMDKTSGETAVGVALYDAAAATYVAVACDGCIVNAVNADQTTDIDAGTWLGQDDNTVKGTVSAGVAANDRCGYAVGNSTGSDTVKMMVSTSPYIAAT